MQFYRGVGMKGKKCKVYMSEVYLPMEGMISNITDTFIVIDNKIIPWTNILFIEVKE